MVMKYYYFQILILVSLVLLITSCNKSTNTVRPKHNKTKCTLQTVVVNGVISEKYEYENNVLIKKIEYDSVGVMSGYTTYKYDEYLSKIEIYRNDSSAKTIYCENNNELPLSYRYYTENILNYYDSLWYENNKVTNINYYNPITDSITSNVKYIWNNNNITQKLTYSTKNNIEELTKKLEYIAYDNLFSPYTMAGIKSIYYNSVNNLLTKKLTTKTDTIIINYSYEYNILGFPTKMISVNNNNEINTTEYLYIYSSFE